MAHIKKKKSFKKKTCKRVSIAMLPVVGKNWKHLQYPLKQDEQINGSKFIAWDIKQRK